MDYTEQQQFLKYGRIWGAALAASLVAIAACCLAFLGAHRGPASISFALTITAMAISLCYTPDYLHLTVDSQKRSRWEVMVRWRLAGVVLVIGVFLAFYGRATFAVLIATAWLAGANLLAKTAVPSRYFSAYFWATDFLLIAVLLLGTRCDLLLATALLTAAAHLSVLVCEKSPFRWAGVVIVSGWLLILAAVGQSGGDLKASIVPAGLLLAVALETAWLVHRAQQHNGRNINAALRELMDFTGYPVERIWHLWSTSNQELAKKWQLAGLDESDREQMAAWYRAHSELYIFAISAYNLDYKRIRSNLLMLKFASGSCLDYGAGNGELVLELARRGRRATFYDVEGKSMRFAQMRAKQLGLAIEFLHSKDDLAASARKRGFDTVFSFDVLEHIPDLPGELDFLSSLLHPGGLLVFDVPAGSTKSHPMHLNHNLDIHTHMRARGLRDEQQNLLWRLPFRKQEKYMFRAPV